MEFEKEHIVDFLLCGSSFFHEAAEKSSAVQICNLSGREEVAESSKRSIIFKFQSAEEIKKEILRLYQCMEEETKSNLEIYGDTKFLGFISPAGGCFCSTLAITAAALFGAHCRTAFVSFDPFVTVRGTFAEQYAITEAIYLIRQGETRKEPWSDLAIRTGEFDSFTGCLHWADLTEIESEEAFRFLEFLGASMGYQAVVIDTGCICRATAGLLAACQMVYEPFFGTLGEEEKHKEWMRQCQMNDPDISLKLQRIRPPYDEKLADGKNEIQDLTDGVLGKYMRELLF